jgi:hypothetical protein
VRVLNAVHEIPPGASSELLVPLGQHDASLAVEGGQIVLERLEDRTPLFLEDVLPPGAILKMTGGVYRLRNVGSVPARVWSRVWWKSEPDGTCPCDWQESDGIPLPM